MSKDKLTVRKSIALSKETVDKVEKLQKKWMMPSFNSTLNKIIKEA